MRHSRLCAAFVLGALLATVGFGAAAQTGSTTAAKKPGLLHRIFGKHPQAGHMTPMGHMTSTGQIIGNKNSHAYHLPGDKGTLPAQQNRVYFKTEAEAKAAGYHLAGAQTSHGMGGHMSGTPRSRMNHGGGMSTAPGH